MIMCGSRAGRGDWKKLFGVGLLVLTVLTVRCQGGNVPLEDPFRLGCRLTEIAECLRLHVDSVVGAHTTKRCLMFLDMGLQVITEGVAGGLNVIAVFVAEILRGTGVGDTVSIPHFTPEGIAFAVKWMLLTAISCYLLCAVLRLTVALLRRVFWMLKAIVIIWIFTRLASNPKASPVTMISHLFWLVMFKVVQSIVNEWRTDLTSLRSRLTSLEGRVAVMEREDN